MLCGEVSVGNYMQKEFESLETLSIVSLQYRTMYLVVMGMSFGVKPICLVTSHL